MRIHPDVLTVDLAAASAYYDSIDRRLGDRLSQVVVDAISQIEANPLLFSEYVPGFRRVVLVPFPSSSTTCPSPSWVPTPGPRRSRRSSKPSCALVESTPESRTTSIYGCCSSAIDSPLMRCAPPLGRHSPGEAPSYPRESPRGSAMSMRMIRELLPNGAHSSHVASGPHPTSAPCSGTCATLHSPSSSRPASPMRRRARLHGR